MNHRCSIRGAKHRSYTQQQRQCRSRAFAARGPLPRAGPLPRMPHIPGLQAKAARLRNNERTRHEMRFRCQASERRVRVVTKAPSTWRGLEHSRPPAFAKASAGMAGPLPRARSQRLKVPICSPTWTRILGCNCSCHCTTSLPNSRMTVDPILNRPISAPFANRGAESAS